MKKRIKVAALILCTMLLVLTACGPAKDGSAVNDSSRALHSETGLAKPNVQLGERMGVLIDSQGNNPAINYNNCSHLYAVQPGDTLADVAHVSATTEGFVLSRNGLDSANDIYPGLVLCLENGNGGIIPPTGGERSGVEVTGVTTDRTVTVRGVNFPEGESMNVYMFQQGVSRPNVVFLGEITISSGGTFERSFNIPTELRAFRNLIIRFRNPDENVSASATFINANVDRVTPAQCAQYYTIRSGDALGVVAQELNIPVERLIQLNNLIDANVVFPGQMLCIDLR